PKKKEKRKKRREKGAKSKLYKLEGEKVKRLRPYCPRCGPGVFMADHGDRFACGRCGYTDFKK
ncbi:MAG: 30S ribosomal protein S27ae, partial [Candidatus Hadarchaeota archaeon]|nr:30S ribosomal protein S27ae [Candidatus Hadarchaeota archaeon]